MTLLLVLAALLDVALVAFIAHRVVRSRRRGFSLRLRLFFALTAATLLGGLATGVYATALDAATLGFAERFTRVLPKGFLVASALLPLLAAAASWVGARLARPVEQLSEAAARIAEGEEEQRVLHPGQGAEAVKLAKALTTMRRELADKPYAAAFLRDAWHDLKTPVAAISATLEVLEDGALDDRDAASRFIQNLRRSTAQLERLLEDLVMLARFETSALREPELLDLGAIVEEAARNVEPFAHAKRVTLTIAPSAPVRARVDAAAVTRALGNLLDNAVRASPAGTVTLTLREEDKQTLTLDLSNEPAEIPVAIRDRLFRRAALAARPGAASAAEAADRGGSGLGLAIARAAIEAHGGTVRFVSMGPPRVTVRVVLPR